MLPPKCSVTNTNGPLSASGSQHQASDRQVRCTWWQKYIHTEEFDGGSDPLPTGFIEGSARTERDRAK